MENTFCPADLLLPDDCDMKKWSVVACDQFSSQPEYWEALEQEIGDSPSTLHMILPEAYLDRKNQQQEAEAIHETMLAYLSKGVFRLLPNSFVYLERTLSGGEIRKGLIGAVDLEAYSYGAEASSPVRATEATVQERLPARVKIRRSAPLEMPHVMVFLDDRKDRVLGMLSGKKEVLPCVYDFDLNGEGGHITGWQIAGHERSRLEQELEAYEQERAAACTEETPVLYAVGDGNHSLAAAKEYWEEIKAACQTEEERKNHPARYCLAELVNIHDEAITFEPIHRVLFETESDSFVEEAVKYWKLRSTGSGHKKEIRLITGSGSRSITVCGMTIGNLIAEAERFCQEYCSAHGGTVDYIHNDETAISLGSRTKGAALLLPRMDKEELFTSISRSGPFPKKSFSIGHAADKRYYLECRKIQE